MKIKNCLRVIVMLGCMTMLTSASNAAPSPLVIRAEYADGVPLYSFYTIENRNPYPAYYAAAFSVTGREGFEQQYRINPCSEDADYLLSGFGLFKNAPLVPANSTIGVLLVHSAFSPENVEVNPAVYRQSTCPHLERYVWSDNLTMETDLKDGLSGQANKWLKISVTASSELGEKKAFALIQIQFYNENGRLNWLHTVGVGQANMLKAGETQYANVDLTRFLHDDETWKVVFIPLEMQ